jgi:hypothetical protein
MKNWDHAQNFGRLTKGEKTIMDKLTSSAQKGGMITASAQNSGKLIHGKKTIMDKLTSSAQQGGMRTASALRTASASALTNPGINPVTTVLSTQCTAVRNKSNVTTATRTTTRNMKEHTTRTKTKDQEKSALEPTTLPRPERYPTSTQTVTLREVIWAMVPSHMRELAKQMINSVEVSKYKPYTDIVALLAIPPDALGGAIAELAANRWKSSATVVAKLATLNTIAAALPGLVPDGMTLLLRTLKRQYLRQRTVTWLPSQEGKVVLASAVNSLLNTPQRQKATALIVSWMTGQRLGDVLKWRTLNLQRVRTVTIDTYAQLVVEGKTVSTNGPFTIHFPLTSTTTKLLVAAASLAHRENRPYIFLDAPTLLVGKELDKAVTKEEQRLKSLLLSATRVSLPATLSCDLRGLRRGGISTMSAAGHSQQDILLVSRHSDTGVLNIYEAAGLLDSATARIQQRLILSNEAAALEPTRSEFSALPAVVQNGLK